jgi:GntR family transcriptional regulator
MIALRGISMLDRTSPKPLHLQMEEIIKEKLNLGEWTPGQAIPSENELSRVYGVSRMTARNVITKLVHEGLLDRIPGKGTFVKEPKIIASPLSYSGIREQLEQMGYEVSTKLLSIKKAKIDESISKHFGLAGESRFFVVQRLRYIKGVPLSIHTSYIPAELCPELEKEDLEHEQLCVILCKKYGMKNTKTIETLESAAASKEEAKLLSVSAGHPLLLLEDTISDENQRVYEYAKVIFRGDKIKIHLSF